MSSAFQTSSLSPPLLSSYAHPPTWRQYSRERFSPTFSSRSFSPSLSHYHRPQQTKAQRHSGSPGDADVNSNQTVFPRNLRGRTMPNRERSEGRVLNRSQQQSPLLQELSSSSSLPAPEDTSSTTYFSRKHTSASIPSVRSHYRSSSPALGSKTPLTPDESPEIPIIRKRNASETDIEPQQLDTVDSSVATPYDRGKGAGDSTSAVPVCICQPDPKIPRPRNAFILYRQHHQASVVAKNPGLANPEISKIIGEQWRNQPAEVKNEWKALAEEEKLRHQQQYPTYRYQPKRNTGRRNSASSDTPGSAGSERARCPKCGGRTILPATAPAITSAASTHYHTAGVTSSPSAASLPPPTPISNASQVNNTIPPLRDLALHSPTARRSAVVPLPPQSQHASAQPSRNMTQMQHASSHHFDERGPLSPQTKRRRYEPTDGFGRNVPGNGAGGNNGQARYSITHSHAPHGMTPGPATPYPFAQSPAHAYAPPSSSNKRDSLPGLRGVMSPQAQPPPPPMSMIPPMRPGSGYQQHRIAQGHHPDRSLTLPPLQTTTATATTVSSPSILTTAGGPRSAEEIIMSMNLSYKIKVLGQISPPTAPKPGIERGLLIAVEGDDAAAALDLSRWLRDTLAKEDDRVVTLLEGPDVNGGEGKAMARYHRLVADWVEKSESIVESLVHKRNRSSTSAGGSSLANLDSRSKEFDDTAASHLPSIAETPETSKRRDSASSTHSDHKNTDKANGPDKDVTMANNDAVSTSHHMKLSTPPATASNISAGSKPVIIVPNYSYHASNVFACRIPIADSYSPPDHWQWAATQWRGTAPPDLTVFVRDGGSPSTALESAKQSGVPQSASYQGPGGTSTAGLVSEEELRLFIVSSKAKSETAQGGQGHEVEPSVLRRLAFEVNERVMAGGMG